MKEKKLLLQIRSNANEEDEEELQLNYQECLLKFLVLIMMKHN